MSRASRNASTENKIVRKKKKPLKGLLILILLLAVAVGFGGAYTLGLRAVEPGNEDPVMVEIPNGSGASMIVQILDDAGLVRSPFWAKVNAKLGGYDSLQANTYVFNKSMAFNSIMGVINEGNFDYISKETVEVKDGARLEQVAARHDGNASRSRCAACLILVSHELHDLRRRPDEDKAMLAALAGK